MERRAILIQNLAGFVAELQPHYSVVLHDHVLSRPDLEREFLQWLARKIIEEVYCLFDARHIKNESLFSSMFHDLTNRLPFSIEQCFKHYIEAPHLYPSNLVVDIKVVGKSTLTIHFTAELRSYQPR